MELGYEMALRHVLAPMHIHKGAEPEDGFIMFLVIFHTNSMVPIYMCKSPTKPT